MSAGSLEMKILDAQKWIWAHSNVLWTKEINIREWSPLGISNKSKPSAAFLDVFCVRVHPFTSPFSSQTTGLEKPRLDFVPGAVPCEFPSHLWHCSSGNKPGEVQEKLQRRNLLWDLSVTQKMVKLMLDVQALSHSHWIPWCNSKEGGCRQWNQQEDWLSTIFPQQLV